MNADVDTVADTLAVAEVTTLAETLGNVSNDALVDMMLTRSQRLRLQYSTNTGLDNWEAKTLFNTLIERRKRRYLPIHWAT